MSQQSTEHEEVSFQSLNLRDTLTSPGATPFDNCLLTLSAYNVLYLLEINFFAD